MIKQFFSCILTHIWTPGSYYLRLERVAEDIARSRGPSLTHVDAAADMGQRSSPLFFLSLRMSQMLVLLEPGIGGWGAALWATHGNVLINHKYSVALF